jgi:hypothetical protein
MPPTRNLLIVHTPDSQDLSDWAGVKERIDQRAPDIDVRIIENGQRHAVVRRWQVSRPSLVFSPCEIEGYEPRGGRIYAGRHYDKSVQVRRLSEAGVSVPRSTELLSGLVLKPEIWGDYVIVKPFVGRAGQQISLVKTTELARRVPFLTNRGKDRMLVQQYVDQVDDDGHLIDWRVLMIFGRPIYASRRRSSVGRRPLQDIANDPMGVVASNVAGTKRDWELIYDEDVLSLARQAAMALGEIPVIGVDMGRDRKTGRLFIFECNPRGRTWHISSQHGRHIFKEEHRLSLYNQFGALDVTADALIEKTRTEAV